MQGLWEETEQQARIVHGLNESWSVISIMLYDGKAFYTLKQPEGANEIKGNIQIPLTKEVSHDL